MNRSDVKRTEQAIRTAVIPASLRLRERLTAVRGGIESELKSDDSRVTAIDHEVELSLSQQLATLGLPTVGEEGTVTGHYDNGSPVLFFDPTDGTALVRILAPGSTVGACLYNPQTHRFEAAAVADPWFGRVVYTFGGLTYQQAFDVYSGELLGDPARCRVSSSTFAEGGEVLIEVAHGFTRNVFDSTEKRRVLNARKATNLWHDVQHQLGTKVRSCSSNLMHQLLVASGGDAIATVMTAIGGPWDMSGVALVLGAGGTVVYLATKPIGFVLVDDPMSADLVVCASSPATAASVVEIIMSL